MSSQEIHWDARIMPAFASSTPLASIRAIRQSQRLPNACPCDDARKWRMAVTNVNLSRRDLLQTSIRLAALAQIAHVHLPGAAFAADAPAGPFEVPPLPYDYAALEPAFDSETMRLHHDKHFVAYTTKLNAAVPSGISNDADLEKALGKLSAIKDESVRKALRNNGGGYLNHKLFFASLRTPTPDNAPTGDVASIIEKEYGSFKAFQEKFAGVAIGLFGSGFVYLVKNGKTKAVEIRTYANQDTPAMDGDGSTVLVGLDVWEHAYYKKFGPKRGDYVNAWWSVVDWDVVASRMA